MNFATVEFGIFFAAVCAVYFLLDHRWQNRFLLLASYVFYGWWDWRFCSLMLLSSVVDYACALLVDRERNPGVSIHRPFIRWYPDGLCQDMRHLTRPGTRRQSEELAEWIRENWLYP